MSAQQQSTGKSKSDQAPRPLSEMDEAMRKKVKAAIDKIDSLTLNRKSINEQIKACYDDIEALGLSRKAAKHVLKLVHEDTTQRDHYDLSVRLIREVAQITEQIDLLKH